ncbi:MAG: ribonuclease D [Gordonia sp. (in: high G+C Gram-positive bacteria)]|uniref:HRDC domain-containing protein n=1 Tax=Gordonia sp. (in: high G+C Gram-positive bacteria) TaxID=84139 RepID=UPI0039E4F30A
MSSAQPADPADADVTPLLAPADGVPPVLSTPADFSAAAAELASGSGPIALDTERASGYRYSQRAYLVQLRRTGSGSFLIDPIDHPGALGEVIDVLDGPEWILHSAEDDLPCLTELGFRGARLFDTAIAGRILGLPKVNLAAMVAHFLRLGLVKGHGAADWSRRPLPDDWLNYAALDVEVLVELRDAMHTALLDAGRLDWALQEFDHVLHRPPASPRTDRWRRTSQMHTLKTARQLAIVRELWTAREEVAARRDIAPGRVLPDTAIVSAAVAAPTSEAALTRLPVFGGPRQRRQARIWLSAVTRALALDEKDLPPRRQRSTGPPPINRWEQRDPEAARRIQAVRPAVKEVADGLSIPAEVLLAPDLVRELCWTGIEADSAADVETWLSARGARPWQCELTGPVIAAALAGLAD